MCGIVGSLKWGNPDPPGLIKRMTQALNHRGPDALGVQSLGPLTLGHARLSIIDTSISSNQPMQDQARRYWIVYNGEIYNYQVLRQNLKALGHSFSTRSDTEVILEAYKEWGVDCLQHFVGMFALAIWDNQEKTLFMARDRLGEKPLYYALFPSDQLNNLTNHSDIIFASELKSMLLHPQITFKINPRALNEMLSLNYTLTDSCMIDNVHKLAPAHYLLIQPGKSPLLKQYWNLSQVFQQKKLTLSKAAAIEELNHFIQEAVRGQMISDVPLGAFLSGGIDSSTIVAAMTEIGNAKLTQTFSTGFREKSYNELAESRIVANHLSVDHHTQIVDGNLTELLPKIIQHCDEPLADTSIIPTYFLAKFAREQVKVCLSGDGGDELFAGYETYAADKIHRWLRFFPKGLLNAASSMAGSLLPVSHQKISLDYKVKKFLQGCHMDFRRAHYFWRTIFTEAEKRILVQPDLHARVFSEDPFHQFNQFYKEVEGCHPLDQASYVDIKTWLVDDVLVKVDRFSMAHSLETRAPFLDHRLVEFAASLPVQWKMKGFEKKHLLKISQKKKLPHSTLFRAKKGFNAPISTWFMKDLQSMGREITLDTSLEAWFVKKEIENLWQEHLSGHKDQGLKLFGLTCFGLWLNHYQSLQSSSKKDNL